MEHYIRTQEPAGLAVIDWGGLAASVVRNWQDKDVYRRLSRQLVVTTPDTPSERIVKEAQYEFEFAARQFMLETLHLSRRFGPAPMGLLPLPDCYNHDWCAKLGDLYRPLPPMLRSPNDQLSWLCQSTALFPSVYLEETLASSTTAATLSAFVSREAFRVADVHHAKSINSQSTSSRRPTYSRVDSQGLARYVLPGPRVLFLGEPLQGYQGASCPQVY